MATSGPSSTRRMPANQRGTMAHTQEGCGKSYSVLQQLYAGTRSHSLHCLEAPGTAGGGRPLQGSYRDGQS